MKYFSAEIAAKMIGISSATIRNWVKSGHIKPTILHPLSFSEDILDILKNQISDGTLQKMQTRANKSQSTHTFIPLEYLSSFNLQELKDILNLFQKYSLEIEPLLFLAAICQLENKGEIKRFVKNDVFDLENANFSRSSVKTELDFWSNNLKITNKLNYSSVYEKLKNINQDDFLGVLYQSLRKEGDKSDQGSYYTPFDLVESSLSNIAKKDSLKFLDPCCGTGNYLIGAAKILFAKPEFIFGFDIDKIAIQIARINLLMHFFDREFSPNIFCLDSLSDLANGDFFCNTNYLIDFFDVIATNPPWGSYRNANISNQFKETLNSNEMYSMFIVKSTQLLKDNGSLSFILPESILKIKNHADIRKFLLFNNKISKIRILGRKFTGVFTPVIILDAIKNYTGENIIEVISGEDLIEINQSRFVENSDYVFDISVNITEKEIIKKIYSVKHITLKNNAEWALGIVTGDNKKYLSDEKLSEFEPIFRGREVNEFFLLPPKTFIKFSPEKFQQVAPEKFFRAKQKLVYRFISKKLTFSLDETGSLTLNSANILIPKIPNMSIKVTLGFLNSTLFQYLFKKKFSTHKVLRGDVEKLPFPILAQVLYAKIEHEVNKILNGKSSYEQLNKLVYEAFEISIDESEIIENSLKE